MAESYPRSSLMESFVPFGGFFSAPSDLKSSVAGGAYQCMPRCHLCNEKCEQEVYALSKGGFSASVADHYQSSLPSWLQMTELGANKELNAETQDDGVVLSAKITGLQKKWDSICQCLHHNHPFPEANTYQVASKFPTVVGFQFVGDKTGNVDNHSSSNASENEAKSKSLNSCLPTTGLQKNCTLQQGFCSPMVSEAKNDSFVSKLRVRNSKVEDLTKSVVLGSSCSLSNSSVDYGSRTSPTSATSVTTNLGLGMFSASGNKGSRKASTPNHIELPQDLSGCSSGNIDLANESIHNNPVQTSACSGPDFCSQNEPRDMKMIFRALIERVVWQKEAISVVSQTIARCQTRNERRHGATPKGDIWFNFSGPDRRGKKKIALALAEILYGSRENFVHVDLSSTIDDRQEMNNYNEKFRGKTAVDYIAGELHKKPLSVVFLENVDKADVLVQNSLSRAVQMGKFSDSHGREISINNTIFLTTSSPTKGARNLFSRKKSSSYCEDRIVRAKGWPIQILIVQSLGNATTTKRHTSIASVTMKSSVSDPISANKRKPIGGSEVLERQTSLEMAKCAHKASTRYLDLNLPAEENEVLDVDSGSSDNDSFPENSTNWLQDFLDQVDATVWLKPFDFDALAERFLKEINHSFCSIFGSGSSLEINSKVMEQLLSAAYLSDRDRVVEEWVEQVLKMGFVEVHERLFKNLNVHYVVKVVAREDLPQALGFRLPARIIVN